MNRYGPRGNIDKVKAAAAAIAARLLTEESLGELMKEYRVGYQTMIKYVYPLIRPVDMKILKAKQRQRYMAGGKKTRFQKGFTPWNKGVKGLRFSPATEFKKGNRTGAAHNNYRPVGSIKIHHDKCGQQFRWIKVAETGKQSQKYLPYARHLWLKHKGPVPAGRFIVHADGDTLNDNLKNLRLVDRRGHINLMKQRMTPEAEARRRRNSARKNRSLRVNQRRSESLKRTFAKKRRARTAATVWECPSCGADYPGPAPPPRCAKCGGYTLIPRQVLSKTGS